MVIDQKANLKRMRELLFLMKEELENEPKQRADISAVTNSVLPVKDEEKLKAELVEMINKSPVIYSDLERIDTLLYALRKPLRDMAVSNFDKYNTEFKKLCHHKYDLSAEYVKALNDSGWHCSISSVLEGAKKDVRRDLKDFNDLNNHGDYINVLLWMIREDGLYGPEYWHKYDIGIGCYNGLWCVPEKYDNTRFRRKGKKWVEVTSDAKV